MILSSQSVKSRPLRLFLLDLMKSSYNLSGWKEVGHICTVSSIEWVFKLSLVRLVRKNLRIKWFFFPFFWSVLQDSFIQTSSLWTCKAKSVLLLTYSFGWFHQYYFSHLPVNCLESSNWFICISWRNLPASMDGFSYNSAPKIRSWIKNTLCRSVGRKNGAAELRKRQQITSKISLGCTYQKISFRFFAFSDPRFSVHLCLPQKAYW